MAETAAEKKAREEAEEQQKKEAKEREQADARKAKLPAHVQKAQTEMTDLADRASKAMDKIKYRLAQGTFTEPELAELTMALRDEEDEKDARTSARGKDNPDREAKPAELGKPRPDHQKSEERVQRQIDKTMEKISALQKKLDSGTLSESETMEAQQSLADQVAKLERLVGGMNPAAA